MAISQKPTPGGETQRGTKEELSRVPTADAKRLNVPVPPDLYRRMKQRAASEDRTMAEITRDLWVDYLSR